MNAKDKKQAGTLADLLNTIMESLSANEDTLAQLAGAEREKFDNLSDGLQQAEKGQAIDEAANSLEEAVSELEASKSSLETVIDKLREVSES
jgi:hypothetical protein